MDKFTEELIPDTVATVVRVLGIPPTIAELAVRHAFDCPQDHCPVYRFLLDRVNAATAQLTGVSKAQVAAAVAQTAKAADDTVALKRQAGMRVGYEELRAAYDNAGPALDLTMDILMEKP